jgi:aspartokinase-like uncharacterized kinase
MDATIVKIGGSLAKNPRNLRTLCLTLNNAAKTQKLVIVPGGGEFADKVREYYIKFHLSDKAGHEMAILGMDQYGYVLSNLIFDSQIIRKIQEISKMLDLGKIPVFLPSNLFLNTDPLENSWDVTSDSIAVYIAGQLGVCKVILVTDVDGVFTSDPKKHPDAKLFEKTSAKEMLTHMERSSVDKFLPKLLTQRHIECYVVNGLFPERLEAVLENRKTVCTLIT